MSFTIGFSRPKKKWMPFSWAIRTYMNTEYSHTYIAFTVKSTGQRVVYQANKSGVTCTEYSDFCSKNTIIDEIELTSEEGRTEALRFCINMLGKSYSFLALVAILLNIKYGDGTRTFICSELVARALKLPFKDMATPKDIREYLSLVK